MDEMSKRTAYTRNTSRRYRHRNVRTSVIINGEEVDFGEYSGAGQYEPGADSSRFFGFEPSSIYGATIEGTDVDNESPSGTDVVKKQSRKRIKPAAPQNHTPKVPSSPGNTTKNKKKGNSGCGCGCLVVIGIIVLGTVVGLLSELFLSL